MQSLVTWDGGNQLTYPIKYIAIGYGEDEPKELKVDRTGFELDEARAPGLKVIDPPEDT